MKYPLRKSKLPRAEEIMPYLHVIDDRRRYSNFGPLSKEFERRLAAKFGIESEQLQLVSNATTGLYLALAALDVPKGSYCAVPSLTFPATVSAVLLAGLTPLFVDIDPDSLTISAKALLRAASNYDIAAAVPVSFFGNPLSPTYWTDALSGSSIKVAFDAAWCFDNLEPSAIPSVVSLHATKVFGIGEGGFLSCLDRDVVQVVRRDSNFGMTSSRDIVSEGINGKMSEYSAAVGLAALDSWDDRRSNLLALQKGYASKLEDIDGLHVLPHCTEDHISGSMCVALDKPVTSLFLQALKAKSIDARYWWGRPCHTLSAFQNLKATNLEVTDDIASRVVNLPFYEGLSEEDVKYIAEVLFEALQAS